MGQYDAKLDLSRDILELGRTHIGGRFIPQNNGLAARKDYALVTGEAVRSIIGYQMRWFVTGDATYRMNDNIEMDPRTIFEAAIKRGMNTGATYIEVYQDDIENPDFQDILSQGRQHLLSVPRIFHVEAVGSAPSSIRTIRWRTYEDADSQIEYGVTPQYGSMTPLDSSRVTAHAQSLSELAEKTVYHYRVRSKDADGNLAFSDDHLLILE